jgi:predicted nucleic acid-binding protein
MISMSDEAAPQFVDTNLLIYAYDVTAGKRHCVASELIDSIWAARNGCLSIQVLQEFFVVGMRTLPQASVSELRARIESLSEWRVHQPSAADVLAAIDLHERYRISLWDAMILHSAREMGCSTLWSEDLNHGQAIGGVTVTSPFIGTG